MKETLVKVIALLGLVAILGLAACDVVPPSGTTSSTTTSTGTSSTAAATPAYMTNVPTSGNYTVIVIGLNVDATNLWDSAGGQNNVIYLVGDVSSNKFWPSSNTIETWNPGAQAGLMTKDPVTGYYYCVLLNQNTNNVTYGFKFVNGSPSFGGAWSTEEQQFATNAGFTNKEGINANRNVDVLVGSNTYAYFTNDHITNVGGYTGGKIATWKAVAGTYSVTNVLINITFLAVQTNTFVEVDDGTNVQLHGSLNGWSAAADTKAVSASNVTFVYTNYFGSATIDYQVRTIGTVKYLKYMGGNFSYTIPAAKSGSTLVITNSNGLWAN